MYLKQYNLKYINTLNEIINKTKIKYFKSKLRRARKDFEQINKTLKMS